MQNSRVNSRTINWLARVKPFGDVESSIRVASKETRGTAKEDACGGMARLTKECGRMGRQMATES